MKERKLEIQLYSISLFSEFETLSEFVELGGLVQHDSQLRVDASGSLSFQVAGVNRADGGQAILLQNL